MPKTIWTESEIDLLRRVYGKAPVEELIRDYFPKKTSSSIKWQVERQKLGGADYWADWEFEILELMRKQGLPFRLISKVLHRSEQAIIVKASKHKIRAPRRDDIDDEDLMTMQKAYCQLDSKLVGSITEDQVRVRLSLCGYDLFMPYMNNHKTDLLVLRGSSVCRIQIKSAVYDAGNKRFRSILRTKDRNGKFIGYAAEDVDFFIVKCNGLEEYYIVPFEVGNGQHSLNLYPHRPKMICTGVDFEVYRNAFHLLDDFLGQSDQKEEFNQTNALDSPSSRQ